MEFLAGEVAIVAVPFPAQSHLDQLLHLSLILSQHGLSAHYVASGTHNRQARDRIHGWDAESVARIQFHDIPIPPFPTPHPDPNSISKFPSHLITALEITEHLRSPLASLLRSLSGAFRRVVVIHDPLIPFASSEAALLPNAEGYPFYCVSAFSQLAEHWDQQGDEESSKARTEVLDVILASFEDCIPSDFKEFVLGLLMDSSDDGAATLFNTCRPIEGEFIDLLARQPFFRSKPLFAVGPVALKKVGRDGHECLKWLDKQPPSSVLYVSFGTTSTMSDDQIKQLATALLHSGERFIWVVRDADRSDIFADGEMNWHNRLPLEYDRQVQGVGVVIRGWAPQQEILAHSSTGGFMSHCGWNSCMESMSMGVPILAWPMHSDQPKNALVVTEYLKVGVLVRDWVHRDEMVSSDEIENSINRMMVLDEGKEITRRAKELGEAIRQDAREGAALSSFIAHITR